MIKRYQYLLLAIGVLLLNNCTIFRSPNAVYEKKTAALDYYYLAMSQKDDALCSESLDKSLGQSVVPAAYFEKGDVALRAQNVDSAREGYENALVHSKNYGLAKSRLKYLNYLEAQGELEVLSSLKVYSQPKQAALQNTPSITAQDGAVSDVVTQSDLQMAEKPQVGFQSMHNPLADPQFHLQMAQTYLDQKVYQEALQELKIVIRDLQKEMPEAYMMLLKVHYAQHNPTKANRVIRLMEEKFPLNAQVHYEIGNYFLKLTKFRAAKMSLLRSIDLEPSAKAYNNLGIIYKKLKKNQDALECYNKALNLDKDEVEALLNKGILYEQQLNDNDNAVECYRLYIDAGGKRAEEVKDWIEEIEASENM